MICCKKKGERNGLLIALGASIEMFGSLSSVAFYLERRLSAFIVRARVHNEACIVLGFFVYSTVKSPYDLVDTVQTGVKIQQCDIIAVLIT
jgi:hypothetical protein